MQLLKAETESVFSTVKAPAPVVEEEKKDEKMEDATENKDAPAEKKEDVKMDAEEDKMTM